MTKERRLGRGLEALLGRIPTSAEPTPPADEDASNRQPDTDRNAFPRCDAPHVRAMVGQGLGDEVSIPFPSRSQTPAEPGPGDGSVRIAIHRIDNNPFQPRRDFDEAEIDSMAESLEAYGLLQPVVVRQVGDRYQLVAGERRLRAATKAGWSDVPVQVIEADDRQVAEVAIVENLHRKDLNPLEKAASFHRYLEQYACTQEELASRLKLDRSTIANLIRLLELPETVQQAVREAKITQGHARALLPLGDEREQLAFCRRIEEEGWSVRQTETLVQEAIEQADAETLNVVDRDGTKKRPRRNPSEHIAALEQEFRAALGTRVKISHNARGRGKLVIPFSDHEEFERLREHICHPAPVRARGHAG